jgi:hypothetical protein
MSNISTDTGMKSIDLYDTPIDLRPVPKIDPVEKCRLYLWEHGDYFGVQLLEQMENEEAEDIKDIERPREEQSEGTVRT